MSNEDFLSRWSRRKRAAASVNAPALELPVAAQHEGKAQLPDAQPAQVAPAQHEAVEVPDISRLPPVESLTAASDVTAFLQHGVPEDLTRAALRQAWTSDPAIRDFVGLSESSWDFNDPAAMPGFGLLDISTEQVQQMARRVVGHIEHWVEASPQPATSISDRPGPENENAAESHECQETSERFRHLEEQQDQPVIDTE